MRRVIALLCLLALLFGLTGCSEAEVPAPSEESLPTVLPEQPSDSSEDDLPDLIRIACNLTDSFNPYKCTTKTNLDLMPLLYQSLYRLLDDYTVEPMLAAEAEWVDAWTLDVWLGDAQFSDGTKMNARDVAFSCRLARDSEMYGASLTNLLEVQQLGSRRIRFILEVEDANFQNLLTFPVLKYGTMTYDEPIGSGRYILQDTDLPLPYLEQNPLCSEWEPEQTVSPVILVSTEDPRTLLYRLRMNELDAVVQEILPTDLGNLGSTAYYDTNTLLFLGCNTLSGELRDYDLRYALAKVMDKPLLLDAVYGGHGVVTDTPFQPRAAQFADLTTELSGYSRLYLTEWMLLEGYNQSPYDAVAEAKAQAEWEAQLVQAEEEGLEPPEPPESNEKPRLTLTLLCNSDNPERMVAAEHIAEQLARYGIKIVIDSRSYAKYTTALALGEFDLYLAEVRILDNLSIAPLFRYGSGAVYGISEDTFLLESYLPVRTGAMDPQSFVPLFESYLPFIPLLYTDDPLVYVRTLGSSVRPTHADVYANLWEWQFVNVDFAKEKI